MGEKGRHPKYLVVNADEMEPGTFKDRLLLESNPNLVIEGAIISAYAVEASTAYIFLRWAYKTAAQRIEKALAQAYDADARRRLKEISLGLTGLSDTA